MTEQWFLSSIRLWSSEGFIFSFIAVILTPRSIYRASDICRGWAINICQWDECRQDFSMNTQREVTNGGNWGQFHREHCICFVLKNRYEEWTREEVKGLQIINWNSVPNPFCLIAHEENDNIIQDTDQRRYTRTLLLENRDGVHLAQLCISNT